jgi:hypothetical protein
MPQRSGSGKRGSATTTKESRNRTPNTPEVSESEIGRLKVDELRSRLKERGVSGISSLRKDELVKRLVKTLRAEGATDGSAKSTDGSAKKGRSSAKKSSDGGVRTGAASSKSLKYSQEISSTDEEPERPGRSLVTTDHDVIRQWADQRDGVPATIEGTEHGDHLGVLRFDFPGGDSGDRLREVSWDDWFATFDERRLNFIYQEERSDGRQSNFFRLENPDREDA